MKCYTGIISVRLQIILCPLIYTNNEHPNMTAIVNGLPLSMINKGVYFISCGLPLAIFGGCTRNANLFLISEAYF